MAHISPEDGRERPDVSPEDGRERPDDAEDRQTWRAARIALGLLRFDWSEARIALLRQRWAEGLSASTIAKELGPGVSRCAVLGKIHRLKLKQPEFKRRHPRKERARPRAPRPAAKSKRAGMRGRSQLMAAFHALGLDAFFGEPDTRTVHQHAGKAFGPACGLLDLTAATCRWPVGEPGEADFAFCGAAPFKRYPYCVGHCLIAYRPDSGESEPRRAATAAHPDLPLKRAA
jgi:GcrA cell cycle regulator